MKSLMYLTFFFTFLCTTKANHGLTESVMNDINESDLSLLKNLWTSVNVTEVQRVLQTDHPHSKLQPPEVAALYGYNAESHTVNSDGYLLTMHRITGNRTHKSPDGKPVVLLMHGMLCSSMDWVIAGPERGLAFLLADAGYDVWMGNFRGNKYANKHENSKISKRKYWSFSWHEMGIYDLPATIDYVLKNTGKESILYIGHSQGTTAFFVMTSEYPEYNNKIEAMIALAPVTYSKNLVSPIFRLLSKYAKKIKILTDLIGFYELAPSSRYLGEIGSKVCSDEMIPPKVCMNFIFLFAGFNANQFDLELLPAIISHVPAGASAYQMYHYSQLIESGYFRQFDYGIFNIFKYGSFRPPVYKLERVTVPVYLYYSKNDWLAHPEDVKTLHSKLPNVYELSCVPDDKFNHLDFLWAKDVKSLLYHEVMNIMSKHKNSI